MHASVVHLQQFLERKEQPNEQINESPIAPKKETVNLVEQLLHKANAALQLKFESIRPKENHFEILSKFLALEERIESIPDLIDLHKHQFIQQQVRQRLIRCFLLLKDTPKKDYIQMLEQFDDDEFRQILGEMQMNYVRERLAIKRAMTGDLKHIVTQFNQLVIDESRLFHQLFTVDVHLTYLLNQMGIMLNQRCRPLILNETSIDILSESCMFLKTFPFAASLLQDCQTRLAFRAERAITQMLEFQPREQEILLFTRKIEMPRPNTLVMDRGSGEFYPTCSSTVVLLQKLYQAVPVLDIMQDSIFQDLAHECLVGTRASLKYAYNLFLEKQTKLDAQLFFIKNLVFICEKLSLFDINFRPRRTSVAIPFFQTIEPVKDIRQVLESELKQTCEDFILESSRQVIDPLSSFIVKAQCVKYGKLSEQNFALEPVTKSIYDVFLDVQLKLLAGNLDKLKSYIGEIQTRNTLSSKIKDQIIKNYIAFYQLVQKEYTFQIMSTEDLGSRVDAMLE